MMNALALFVAIVCGALGNHQMFAGQYGAGLVSMFFCFANCWSVLRSLSRPLRRRERWDSTSTTRQRWPPRAES